MDKYGIYAKLLTITQEEIYDSMHKAPIDETPQVAIPVDEDGAPMPMKHIDSNPGKALTPLEYLLVNCYKDQGFLQLTIEAFEFFTHEKVLPLYEEKCFYIGDVELIKTYKSIEDLPLLSESNFMNFQNLVRESIGLKHEEKADPNEDPRITRMKAKARYRDKVKEKSGQTITTDQMLVSICCMGIGITPLTIGEMSFCAAVAIFDKYQSKEKYQLDIDSLLAGADSKKIKPKYWITN